MECIIRFLKSLYDFDKYNDMLKRGVLYAALNVMIVSVFSTIILTAPFISDYIKLGGITGAINKYVPEFTIQDGILSTDKYYKRDFMDELVLLIIDTKSVHTEKELLRYESGYILTKDKIITKSFAGDINIQDYKAFEEMGIKCKADVLGCVPIIKALIIATLFMMIIFVFFQYMVFALFFAVIINFVNYKLKAEIDFLDIFKLSCYATAMPSLLKMIISSFNQFLPMAVEFTMPTIVYLGLIGAYCFYALKAVKEERIREQKENNGRENERGHWFYG